MMIAGEMMLNFASFIRTTLSQFGAATNRAWTLDMQNSMARCCDRYRYLQCFCLIILFYINVLLFTFTKSSLQSP